MDKSCWGLVWWLWKDSKAWIAHTDEVQAEVKLRHGIKQDAAILKSINPTDAICQLGLKNVMIGGHKDNYSDRYKLI
eukprot:14491746-Ditylum_brightwellii.AAC.1